MEERKEEQKMGDSLSSAIFKAIIEPIDTTGKKILDDTDQLKEETNSLLGQIDDTCKSLPAEIYQFLESSFVSWKALLERSDTERERTGTLLQMTAKAIQENEDAIMQKLFSGQRK